MSFSKRAFSTQKRNLNLERCPLLSSCLAVPIGQVEYLPAWELQKSLHKQVSEGMLPNLLLLLEHSHVYTLGRRGKISEVKVPAGKLAELGAKVHFTDRGGEVTYHGPGQLIVYPIVNLRLMPGGPSRYIHTLEKVLIDTLEEFGIMGESVGKPTGVWVGDAKIAAIGVKISRGVTMHGLALNVNPDLSYFNHIVPCGMIDISVTSMSTLLSKDLDVREVLPSVVRCFERLFEWKIRWVELEDLGHHSDKYYSAAC